MRRRYPAPHREVNQIPADLPDEVKACRRRAAEEYNQLRYDLGVGDRELERLLQDDKGRIIRWATGKSEVPYWAILQMLDFVNAAHRDPRSLEDRLNEAYERQIAEKERRLRNPAGRRRGHRGPGGKRA